MLSILSENDFDLVFDESRPQMDQTELSWDDVQVEIAGTTNVIASRYER